MPTTRDVVNQHLKCFGEHDLDGVLADYSSDAVLFIPSGPLRGPAGSNTRMVTTPTSCGVQKPLTIRTKPLPTRLLCGTGK